jgi:cobalt-zinc-cadmium efflux system outer membrane protein
MSARIHSSISPSSTLTPQRATYGETLDKMNPQRLAEAGRRNAGAKNLLVSACILAVLVAGCARFQSQPLSPVQSATSFNARNLADPGLKQFLEQNLNRPLETWPLESWDIPTLTFAAWHFQPSLDVARAQWLVADAAFATAGGRPKSPKPGAYPIPAGTRPNPAVSTVGEYNANAARGKSPWGPGVTFDLPIEAGNKRAQRILKAEYASESARLGVLATAWRIRSEVRTNVLAYAAARHRYELLKEMEAIQMELVQRGEQQLAAGAISYLQLSPLRIQLAKTRLTLINEFQRVMGLRSRVAESVGVPISALLRVQLDYDFAASPDTPLAGANARHEALVGRPDVLVALAEYAAADAALRLEIAKQYPNIHLNPGYQWDQGENKWALGVAFELPAFNRNKGAIAEAEARRELAATQLIRVQAGVIAEIDGSLAGYRAAVEQAANLEKLLAQVKTQLKDTETRKEAGAADQLEVLFAKLEMKLAELAIVDAQEKFHRAFGAAEDATQPLPESAIHIICAAEQRAQ